MRILLVDDHTLFREAIGHVIAEIGDSPMIFEASTAEEAVTIANHHQELDLVLLDLSMPGMGGLAGLPVLIKAAPTVPVVVISSSEDIDDVRQAIHRGAAGYIPKTASVHEMKNALNLVLAGEIAVPPRLLSALDRNADIVPDSTAEAPTASASAVGKPVCDTRAATTLTARQSEVLGLLAEGFSNKAIAHELELTEGTVKLHVYAVLRALNARNRTEAVVVAGRRGLL